MDGRLTYLDKTGFTTLGPNIVLRTLVLNAVITGRDQVLYSYEIQNYKQEKKQKVIMRS